MPYKTTLEIVTGLEGFFIDSPSGQVRAIPFCDPLRVTEESEALKAERRKLVFHILRILVRQLVTTFFV